MGIFRKSANSAREPDAELRNLHRRFRKNAERYERRHKLRAFIRSRWIPTVLALVALGDAYLALDLFSPWPPLVTVKHFIAYKNCDTARLLGLAPARRGEPGYWEKLDRDNDGIACEPVPRWKTRRLGTSPPSFR